MLRWCCQGLVLDGLGLRHSDGVHEVQLEECHDPEHNQENQAISFNSNKAAKWDA